MDTGDEPTRISVSWANNAGAGYVTVVPVASQIGVANGRASWTDGFVPLNFVPQAAGGVPPFGDDMNGAMHQISAGVQWLQAGGPQPFNSAFATAVGGYPQGATIASADTVGLLWVSTVDNNVTDPDAGPSANWVAFSLKGTFPVITTAIRNTPGAWNFTIPAGVFSVRCRVWGAGGGGGGVNGPGAGSGGGGGAYGEKTLRVTPGDTLSGTIGTGGAAGTSASDASPGTATTLVYSATTYTAGGGAGGQSAASNAQNSVAGGTASGSWDFSVGGQPSFGGVAGFQAGPAILYYAGQGGQSFSGGWGGQAGTDVGNPGGAPGGGAGGTAKSTAVTGTGGVGAGGQVTIEYYTP